MNRSRASTLLILPLVLLAACQSTIDRRRMRADLAAEPLFAKATIEEITRLEPKASMPFVLAIAPPRSQRRQERAWEGVAETASGSRSWSEAERRAIESWKSDLVRLGVVTDLVVTPMITAESAPGDATFEGIRAAAARHHAGAVLVVSEVEDASNWLNPWSILDLTIVGAWIAPGHDVEVVSIFEGAVVDVETGYLFATAQGEGTVRAKRAWAYADDPELADEARAKALRALADALHEHARAAVARR